jgi:hypothetical protein
LLVVVEAPESATVSFVKEQTVYVTMLSVETVRHTLKDSAFLPGVQLSSYK